MLNPILVCDDNVTQANKLTMAASHGAIITKEDNNGFELALTAYGYKQALDWVITNQPKAGIYFLDIELEGGTKKHTGLDLALKIKEVDQEAMIVFVTTHEEMAILTFERQIGPLDYITKSTNDEQFQQRVTNCMYTALQRYESEQATSGLKFRYWVGRREHIENFNNIICIETTSRPHVLELITTTSIMQFPGTIKELAKAYPQFCKLSQSCLANLDNIKSVDFKLLQVTFINDSVEPFSRRQTKTIKKALNIL